MDSRRPISAVRKSGSLQLGRLSIFALAVTAVTAVWTLFISPNAYLWIVGVLALLAALRVAGWNNAHPVLLWVIAINWLGIVASPLGADLKGMPLSETELGAYAVLAYGYLLLALVVFAAGIKSGLVIGGHVFGPRGQKARALAEDAGRALNVSRLAIAYFVSLVAFRLLEIAAYRIPSLQQPIVALFALKFIWIYLIAATVLRRGQGYFWLLLVIFSEFIIGITSFFSSYKESVFLTLIALAASGRRINPRLSLFGALCFIFVIWVSLFWTAIKPEYRFWVSAETGEQVLLRSFGERLHWMKDRLLAGNIRYDTAAERLVERLDIIPLYSLLLSRLEAGYVPDLPSRLLGGIEHVLTPRVFFPSKAAISDSAVTTALTGREIGENTSISIGYVAEAYYDLGFPLLLAPVLLIGMLVGVTSVYYMTRAGPRLLCESFMCANLFLAFNFGINFNKALGVFLVGLIALSMLLKFATPFFTRWLAGKPVRSRPPGPPRLIRRA